MKYAKQYETEAAYTADTSKELPNLSLIKENEDVKYNAFKIDGKAASAGTIVLCNTSTPSEKIFVPYQTWDATTYSDYTPIGVVVVPYAHTSDGTVRIMSLKNMSLTTPDSGSVVLNGSYSEQSFYWGGYGSDIPTLANYTTVPNIDETNLSAGTIGSKDWVRIPSNYVQGTTYDGGASSPLDPGTKYYEGTESGRYGISPYTKYNWASYKAHQVISKATNAMNDFDGYGNTSKILAVDNAYSTAWQTASTITNNNGSSAVHAPAQCCWRYTTIGIDAHKWYLPSCGELTYLIARYADINEALTKLMLADGTNAIRLWRSDPTYYDSSTSVCGTWLWSSAESTSDYARGVNVYDGGVLYSSKSYSTTGNRVRAFAALSL